MRTYSLTMTVIAAALFLPACTGGQIEDAYGNPISGIGNTYTQYQVHFESVSTGEVYTTGIDDNGYFGFDFYAPGSASNNRTYIAPGSYNVTVVQNGSYTYSSQFPVTQTYDTQGCQDHYVAGQADPQCALYRLELLPPVGEFAYGAQAPVYDGLITTVQLAGPLVPVTITYYQLGACNGTEYTPLGDDVPSVDNAGEGAAYVVFGIESINNPSASPFSFNPASVSISGDAQASFNSNLAIYRYLLGPFAIGASTVNPVSDVTFGIDGKIAAFGALEVGSAQESTSANKTSYTLSYARQTNDPPVVLVKSNASQTSWTNTQNCLLAGPGNDGDDYGTPALTL